MVRVKVSEYQHAYRGADPTLSEDYMGKLRYAQQRRYQESIHYQSPFDWDIPGPEDLSGEKQLNYRKQLAEKERLKRQREEDELAEKLAAQLQQKVQLVPEKSSPSRKQPVIRKVVPLKGPNSRSKGVQVEPNLFQTSSKSVESFKSTSSTAGSPPRSKSAIPSSTSASSYFRFYKPFIDALPRVRRGPEMPPRSSSALSAGKCYHVHQRITPEEEDILDGTLRPTEFTTYALGNKSRRISGKRTNNVRADRGVYSTALRASAHRAASRAYNPPSSAPYGSPEEARILQRRGIPCSYQECRCSKNYSF